MMTTRPGIMAPPTLYEQPARPGLMSPSSSAPHPDISMRTFLWTIAALLAVVELFAESLS
jgi:hypothetical protein